MFSAAMIATSAAHAAETRAAAVRPSAAAISFKSSWLVTESANFRVLVYGAQPASRQICDSCETLRSQLIEKWLGAGAAQKAVSEPWSPKCDIIIHSTAAGYVRAVGPGGNMTVASSLVDQDRGRIHVRRIDVRGQDAHWQTSALPHEMTHVVLADRFAGQRLPRWADEGVATLADPFAKRQGHLRDLHQAVATRSAFRIAELFTMDDYPPASRWAAFYGQSISLTEYLVDRGQSSEQFVNFVECAMNKGYETALREVYRINGPAELERDWMASIRATKPTAKPTASTAAKPARNATTSNTVPRERAT